MPDLFTQAFWVSCRKDSMKTCQKLKCAWFVYFLLILMGLIFWKELSFEFFRNVYYLIYFYFMCVFTALLLAQYEPMAKKLRPLMRPVTIMCSLIMFSSLSIYYSANSVYFENKSPRPEETENVVDLHLPKSPYNPWINKLATLTLPADVKHDRMPASSAMSEQQIKWEREFLAQMTLHLFVIFGVLGAIIQFLYSYMMNHYTRLNEQFVNLNKQYMELYFAKKRELTKADSNFVELESLDHQSKIVVRQMMYLLREEYILFFKYNMRYNSPAPLDCLFNYHFYIVNLAHAFGFHSVLNEWIRFFRKLTKEHSHDQLMEWEKSLIDEIKRDYVQKFNSNENAQNFEFYGFIKYLS